ncbi:hypothetical protein KQI88_10780 [Alkaliphilus sp. MSJ-5]|uniref:Type II secretion system protein GspF domain-containing protein n=1 Tax=Alkaliphilus flagellatus TaxID=2841507 RepID=A0ABS6G431_9FIRM|nr:hypothetical protein [Alkaliphilus flagellatus]MBU5676901.1 hypothetical protein [Alkaliphilus flagellatus]
MLIILIILLVFMGLLLIINNIDIKRVLNIKARKRTKRNIVKIKNSYLDDKLDYIEKLIQKSNIRIYIPYSIWSHLFICSMLFFLGTTYMYQYINIIVALIFGFGLSTMPFLILRIIADVFAYKIKRSSVDFLIILKNFFIANKNKDIFECFNKASEYVSEPLKSYIDIMIHEHKYKINPVQCLENLKDKIEISELKLFIENLKICYIHGGNIIGLIDAFIEEISEQNDDEDEESTEDSILNMGLYFLIILNFTVIYFLINSSYRYSILEPVWGQIVFALDIIISIYIVIQSMDKLQA